MFKYNNFWVRYNYYYIKDTNILYDVSYTIYDINGRFLTNYFNTTEVRLLEDLKKLGGYYYV